MIPALPIIQGVFGWLTNRQRNAREADAAGERLAAARVGDMSTSWKDEAWTLFFIGPPLIAMWPGYRPHMVEWLEFLSGLPEWYVAGMGVSISASFGMRYKIRKDAHKQRMAAVDAAAQASPPAPAPEPRAASDGPP